MVYRYFDIKHLMIFFVAAVEVPPRQLWDNKDLDPSGVEVQSDLI